MFQLSGSYYNPIDVGHPRGTSEGSTILRVEGVRVGGLP